MLPFSSTAADQIRFLLQNSTDSTFDSVLSELREFVQYGSEGSILLLQTCLDQIDFHGGDMRNTLVNPALISAVLKYLLNRPNFSSVFCEALRSTWVNDRFLVNLSKILTLSTSEKIGIGLALSDSENPEFRVRGQNFCIAQIEELCANPAPIVSHEQIQDIVMFLSRSEGLTKHVDSFTKMLSLLQLKESFPFMLAPMLPEDLCAVDSPRNLDLFLGCSSHDFDDILSEIEKEMSMADIMEESGYGCTVDAAHCKELLSLFLPLTEETISKILGTIVRTRIGLEDTQNTYSTFSAVLGSIPTADSPWMSSWNIDVLVDSIKQLAPETNWTRVMENLDHEGFYIPDEESFSFFMSVYSSACQSLFPLHAICGSIWKNSEGQLSFLKYAVSAPPEIFTFGHSERKLPYIESVHQSKAHGNQAWFCLDLLEVLCQLAERGYANSVRMMLDYPLNHFPDVLLIGIAQCHTTYNLLQNEISSSILPILLKNPMYNGAISHLWHVNPKLLLRGFMDVHNTDPDSIARILEICEELKILLSVLDSTPFSFSIKLAVFASQRECINLDKWLNDNLNAHKDAFYEVCLHFLKGTHVATDAPSENVFQESFEKIFKVLQSHSGQLLSPHLSEEVKRFSSSQLSTGMRSGGGVEISASEGSPDDVETEANAYFHQMFSGQLGIDTMVQTLARFKESSNPREVQIFECMIGNLFEEYKFFPKYPDKQLKIAAVLFGSLIKHQLVTHLTLGIALRCVLDALRKSVDSKMFLFGAKALEQFTDRLIEWPQYCNHILQISHLRSTHADLVSFIERALARISSSQLESNGSVSVEQPPGSGPPSVETVEMMNSGGTSFQIQQRNQGFLEDRPKPSGSLNSHIKPIVSTSAVASVAPLGDSVFSQKVIISQSLQTPPLPASGSSTVLTTPGFLRPSRGLNTGGMPRQPSFSTGFGSALNIETLVAAAERRDTPIEAPASEVQDKIFFMINNLSVANVDAKAKEFVDVLKEQYYPWFAQYMVMKRASIEPNFHDLYLKFLDKVNSKLLNKEIVKTTYENCKVLLRSDLIKSSSEERSLLKNLGSWLGKFTIGRNQALRAREIDPKVLIMEAYEKGLMIAVIPFTSKILEPCQCSLAYQPPNPWTMAILGLLVEIYNLPNLKMNLKFDIEVLFKNLGVDMKDVKPTSLLKDRNREVEGNPDFSNKDISVSQIPVISDSNSGMISTLSQIELQPQVTNTSHPVGHPSALTQYTSPLQLTSSTLGVDDKIGSLSIPERVPSGLVQSQATPSPSSLPNQFMTPVSNIQSHVVVNPKLSALSLQVPIQRIIAVAMEKSFKEIIQPVIQRSVTIACQTTKELVQKDYCMESDESRIHNAANLMVSSLAGSLAHVTCKEPLRVAMTNHVRTILQSMSINSEVIDQTAQLITNDNLDLGCALIEEAASEKALQTIDGEMAPSIAFRRKQRESSGSAYFDAANYAQGPFARVPEALRPKPGRLSSGQQRVYEEFVKYPWRNQPSQNSNVVPAAGPLGSSGGSVTSSIQRFHGSSSVQVNPGIYTMPPAAPGFSGVTQPLDLISDEMDPGSAHILSVSSTLTGANDVAVHQQSAEMNSGLPSFSPATPEPHMVEPPPAAKELGSVGAPSPTIATERLGIAISEPLTTGDALDKYQILAQKLEDFLSKDSRDTDIQTCIQGVIAEVSDIILKCISRDEAALAVAQKVFKRLYENTSSSMHVGAHLAILAAIRDVCKLVVKEVTSWVIYSDDERKFNKDITVGLMRSELLNLAEYDVHLAKLINGERNKAALEFAIYLVQTLVVQEPGVSMSEFYNLIEALTKLAMRTGSPESLQQLVEIARNSTSNVTSLPSTTVSKEEKGRQFRDKKTIFIRSTANVDDYAASESAGIDPAGFRDQVYHLFADWYRISELPATNEAACSHYISQLQQNGLLKGDDLTERFFRVLTERTVQYCLAPEQVSQYPQQVLSFLAIDSYSKLVVLVLKYCSVDQGSSKVILLPKIISVIVRVIQKDTEEKKGSFNPRPYFRLFINLLMDLPSPDPVLDSANFQVLTSFANAFHALQPMKVPGWSFAWLELISHRNFMPKLLMSNNQKGWPFFQRLLVDLFKFMEPYLRNAELGEPVQFLYKGTLRMLLVLLHDFPEFLCDYHFSFCDVIPPSCIQMRNVILSAFPVNMRLPDPCTPNLKIDLLPEISQSPRILSDVDGALKAKQIKADIDEYLKTRPQGSFITDLKQRLLLPPNEAVLAGTRYNVPLINSLVLYVGMQAIQQLQSKSPPQHVPAPQVAHNGPLDIFLVGAAMDIFNNLLEDLDTEGRYLFLNAVANQLRYPNNHTHYFSFVLLYLFAEANQDNIQEQITRVLLERLIVNRPHPWGLLITFIELIKNPRYNFWNRAYTRCAPEIEKLFEQVSRSCGGSRGADDGLVSGGLSDSGH